MSGTLQYAFLSYYRTGFPAMLTAPKLNDGALNDGELPLQLRAHVEVNLELKEDGRILEPGDGDVTMPVEIQGPQADYFQDLTHEVVRTDPAIAATGTTVRTLATSQFEPNYLPLVEFGAPDLPWRNTAVSHDTDHKLNPWIFLAVVTQEEFFVPKNAPLGVVAIANPSAVLPDPAESWAWAHVQVTDLPDDAVDITCEDDQIRHLIDTHPELAVSRLLSSRKLESATHYYAFVLDTLEVWRRAGAGEPFGGVPGDLLISLTNDPLRFRPRYAFEFRTGERGDFESLVTQLAPFAAQAEIGIRDVNFGDPGLVRGIRRGAHPQTVLGIEGALKSPKTESTTWPEMATDPFREDVANLLVVEDDPNDDPVLLPPAFGRAHRPVKEFNDLASEDWFTEVNLDPRHRATASLGYQLVERHQGDILAKAWEWGHPADAPTDEADLFSALQHLQAAELGKLLSTRIEKKHLTGLPPTRYLQLAERLLDRVLERDGGTMADRIGERPDVAAWLSGPARAVTRTRALSRSWVRGFNQGSQTAALHPAAAGLSAATLSTRVLDGVNSGELRPPRLGPLVGTPQARVEVSNGTTPRMLDRGQIKRDNLGDTSDREFSSRVEERLGVEGVQGEDAFLRGAGAKAVDGLFGDRYRDPILVLHFDTTNPSLSPLLIDGDSLDPELIRHALEAALSIVDGPTPQLPVPPALSFPVLAGELRGALSPHQTIRAWIEARYEIAERSKPLNGRLDRVMAHPEFSTPVSTLITKLSKELLLPGVGKIEPNSVTALSSNPAFVTAVLLGFNDAIGRMLLFNRYPTDLRGTYARRFWNTLTSDDGDDAVAEATTVTAAMALARGEQYARDIHPIHEWNPELPLSDQIVERPIPLDSGNPMVDSRQCDEGRVVLLIRGEVLRRYPGTIVYAQRQKEGEENAYPIGEKMYPVFAGRIDPDITYLGFDWCTEALREQPLVFTFEEPLMGARFGMDVDGIKATEVDSWADLAWPQVSQTSFVGSAKLLSANAPLGIGGDKHRKFEDDPLTGRFSLELQWAKSAAETAGILFQQPFRVRVHSKDLIDVPST